MRRRSSFVLCVWLAGCAVIGCNLLLGSESAIFEPDAGGGSGMEGGADGADDASASDATSGGDAGDGALPDANPCTDIQTNAKHCGACGHDCLGGQCMAGKCQPFAIATEPGSIVGLTVDSTHVYWTNRATGDVRRMPIAGGAVETVYDGPGGDTLGESLVRSGAHVYFTAVTPDGGVYRCPAAGCGASAPEPVAALDTPGGMSADDAGTLFVVESFVGGRVGRCAPPCVGTLDVVAPAESYPIQAAGEGDSVYWSTLIPNGGNVRARNAGGSAMTLATGRPAVDVAVVGSEVIFAERGLGPVAISRDGGAVRKLSATSTQTERLVVNNGVVYFNDSTASVGRVHACAVGGCGDAGAVLAVNQSFPYAIAADAVSVYWTNRGESDAGAAVMRIAK